MQTENKVAVSFEALSQEHLETVRNWRNSPEVARYMYTDANIAPDDQLAWFERVRIDQGSLYWVVVLDRRPVGLISLTEIDFVNRRCNWAIYLGEDSARGRGVASQAQHFGAVQCFEKLGLEKLCCEAFEFNVGALALYEKFGFEREGLYVDHYLKNGVFTSVVALGLHRSRWIATRALFDDPYMLPEEMRRRTP